jgi:hypothetical protein
VAEQGALAEREDRRKPTRVAREARVPDGEHAAVDPMQPPAPNPTVDGAAAEACAPQLIEMDDAALRRGDASDVRVRTEGVAYPSYVNT